MITNVRTLTTLLFLNAIGLFSQQDTLHFLNEKLFRYLDEASETLEESELQMIFEELLRDPIDINLADTEELLKIPFISIPLADKIIKVRRKRKRYMSVEEISAIGNIDNDLFILIKPLLKVENAHDAEKKSRGKNSFRFRTRIISDIQNRVGFRSGKFKGNKIKQYNRFLGNFGNFSFGLLSEKDPGEESLIDHYAGFVEFKSGNILERILLGDFNLEFGEGLVLWQPYSFSKGSEAVNTPVKRSRGFKSSLSAEENLFFRGGVSKIRFKRFNLIGFYSSKFMDANVEGDRLINLTLTGYHRTRAEIEKVNRVKRNSFGIMMEYSPSSSVKIGMLHLRDQFSKKFEFESQKALYGKKFAFTSLSYAIRSENIFLGGELSYNGRAAALIGTMLFQINDRADALISYRNYSPYYYNINSKGFGEFGNTQNETGFYLGLKVRTNFGTINFYYDFFKNPLSSYASHFPAAGNDFLFNYDFKFLKGSNLRIKYKRERKESAKKAINKKKVITESKSSFKIEMNYKISKKLSGKTRIEIVEFESFQSNEKGFLTFQQLKYLLTVDFWFIGRIIIFQTDSYNSRVYEFENDLRGVMYNAPLFHEGFRWYLLVNCKFWDSLNLSFKYSETYKPNISEIGSGNSKLMGNLDNRLSFQLDLSL